VQLFYEIKANQKQLRALRDARVTKIQPRVESLSSNALQHMHRAADPVKIFGYFITVPNIWSSHNGTSSRPRVYYAK
jgi:hypothetical protein